MTQNQIIDQPTEKALDLLKFNYENLHSAIWDCHKIFWNMTSILLPITLTAFAWVVKDMEKTSISTLIIVWFLAFSLLTFWWKSSRYLRLWNKKRGARLKELEDYFNSLDLAVNFRGKDSFFKQYIINYEEGFGKLTLGLYIVFLIATLGIVVAKIIQCKVQ